MMHIRSMLSGVFALTAIGLFAIPSFAAEPTGPIAEKLAKAKFEKYADAPGYSEGPTWKDGEVFFCSGALLRVDQDGKVHKHLELGPAGTVLRGEGQMLICDNKNKALVNLAPDGTVSVVADKWETQLLKSLNDLTIDGRGNIYWTDPEGSNAENKIGSVFRVRPDGRVDRVATGLAFPNGLDVDPASKFLYVIESQSKKVLRYALPADDALCGPAEVFYDLQGSGGDGCAFDAEGNLWVADFHRPESGFGRITVLSPKAEVLGYLPVPAKVVSNIAFGGPNHDEIFCTTGDPPGVFHAKVGVKGFAGHPAQNVPLGRKLNLVVGKPHADAETVRKIVAAAQAAAVLVDSSAKFSDARPNIDALLAKISDAELKSQMTALLTALETAFAQHAADLKLLADVKRLQGEAKLEVVAPDWLRAIAGDEHLPVFGRIVELVLNERTDGHKDPEPKKLEDRVNNDWLKKIANQTALRRLELSGTAVTSEGLVHLKGLTNLEFLNICLTACDDSGFEHLAGMTKMKRMTICASKITGSGFKHLEGMQQLESINLHSAPASDEGLAAISKLPSLRRLEIVHTHVTDKGLAHIANLTNLRQLHVHGPETTAAGMPFIGKLQNLYELDIYDKPASNETMAEIAKIPKLRMLRLFLGQFDDEGVKHLAGMTSLEDVVLNSPNVTDASIEHLGQLKNLRTVAFHGTKITPAGIEKLQKLLPNVQVAK